MTLKVIRLVQELSKFDARLRTFVRHFAWFSNLTTGVNDSSLPLDAQCNKLETVELL